MTYKIHPSSSSPNPTNVDDVFLERIPDAVYRLMVENFSHNYHFKNGERMRISNYYVGISKSLSEEFCQFINAMVDGLSKDKFPRMPPPIGFEPNPNNLVYIEKEGGFTLGSFDMAVTQHKLQNIEFQAVSTYPISAAILNKYLLDNLSPKNAYIFADNPETNWDDFITIYKNIIAGQESEGIVITDRKIQDQKTNFEFYATQKALGVPLQIVDMEDLFSENGELYYSDASKSSPIKISRLYNRILLAEALFEDDYPHNQETWKFRFDDSYDNLKFINHPIKTV